MCKGGGRMEFIEWTKPEYRRFLIRRVLLNSSANFYETPGGKVFRAVWLSGLIFLISSMAYNAMTQGAGSWERLATMEEGLWPIYIICGILWQIVKRVGLFTYLKAHKNFVAQVNALEAEQYAILLSEYPAAKKVEIYYDRKKKKLSPLAIYLTDSFLFVPGQLLIPRKEIINISYDQQRHSGGMELIFVLKSQTVEFGIDYHYPYYPKAMEYLLAWFWERNPNDPKLRKKVKDWYIENGVIPARVRWVKEIK